MVSPICASLTVLMPAKTKPTSPTPSSSTACGLGEKVPTCSTWYSCPFAMKRIFIPARTAPSITRVRMMTPRYGSYQESKISAFSGASGSPLGAGSRWTIASRISWTPVPSLALARIAPLASSPTMSSIWRFASSGCAPGRSILLMTGTISRLFSTARYALASVWASTPCDASTMRSAPSLAASDRVTSYEKSTWPGVSIRFRT